MDKSVLPPEFLGLLRLAESDMRNDLIASVAGCAQLVRIIASEIESVTDHSGLNALLRCGIALETIGSVMKLEALRVRP